MKNPEIDSLHDEIDSVIVRIDSVDIPASSQLSITGKLDFVSRQCGYREIGEQWRELNFNEAFQFIVNHIQHDLAYSTYKLVDDLRATSLASRLVALAETPFRIFTSHSAILRDGKMGSYGFTSITDWTFNVGYILIGATRAIAICFMAVD